MARPFGTAVQTVDIKPKTCLTQVTGIYFDKREIKADVKAELVEKKADLVKTYLATVADPAEKHMIDVFRVKDEGGGFYALLRFPTSTKLQLLRLSGEAGTYVRTTHTQRRGC